ncbi:MAG: cell division protein ZapA [Rickettsiales bacterium]|jgi:cell division protein ZapA|nr:cell division protein ZapA [Rickettsiales bacterium]
MSIVNISIANKKYQIGCENGQESRLHELAKMLDMRAAEILDKIGPMSETMLLVTLCVVLADELNESADSDMREILDKIKEIKRKIS